MKDLNANRRLSESSIPYTDDQLLEMLEVQGYKPNYTNLCALKEGIINGNITIDEADQHFPSWYFPKVDPNYGTGTHTPNRFGVQDVDRSPYDEVVGKASKEAEDAYNKYKSLSNTKKSNDPYDEIYGDMLGEAKELKEPTKTNTIGEDDSSDKQKPETAEIWKRQATIDAVNGYTKETQPINVKGNKVLFDVPGKIESIEPKTTKKTTNEAYDFLSQKRTVKLINEFLNESGSIDFVTLTEDVKSEGIKQIAISLLKTLEDKLAAIDTTAADRSKGDIKQLRELQSIQDAINILEDLIERNYEAPGEYSKAVNIVIKSLLYINQYSNVFKDAYRNKKTLMMMKYQALILSIISSVSYLVSVLVSFGKDNIELNTDVNGIIEFSPLKGLADFNKSVESGEFKIVTKDVEVLREYFLEYPVSTMTTVLEAIEYGPMIIEGIKNIYNNLINGNAKLTNLIYRAAGIFVLLLSLRDVLYTLFKMKTKVSDMIQNIGIFANIRTVGTNILSKLGLFTDRFKDDANFSSSTSKREIEEENKKLLLDVKNIQAEQSIKPEPVKAEIIDAAVTPKKPEPVKDTPRVITVKAKELTPKPAPANNDPFGFDF